MERSALIKQVSAVVLVLLMSPVAVSNAQSLAEVARKEQERRNRVAKPAPVYRNEDLATVPASQAPETKNDSRKETAGGAPVTVTADSQSSSRAAAEPVGESAPAELPKAREKRDEKYWRERTTVLQERLERLRADTAALQTRMASLQSDAASAPADKVAALNAELRLVTAEFVRFQNELRLIEQEWNTFEQRARDANVPARWLQR